MSDTKALDPLPATSEIEAEEGATPAPNDLSRPTRDEAGKWVPGCPSPNPLGKPRGGGRVGALKIIDDLLDKAENQRTLMVAFQQMLTDDPIGFWRTIVQPLLPRAATLSVADAETAVKLIVGVSEDRL